LKIIHKAYFLVGILIVAAAVNLILLYQSDQETTDESFTIIQAADLKVNLETIDSLANSIASGDEPTRQNFKSGIEGFQLSLTSLNIPQDIEENYDLVKNSWEKYKMSADQIYETSEFNSDAFKATQYILTNNWKMILATDSVVKEIDLLPREFKRHKEISIELYDLAQSISQNALLITIGEGEKGTKDLLEDEIAFDNGFQNLFNATSQGNVNSNIKSENLSQIPNENSKGLRELDPIWESIKDKIKIIEKKSNESVQFNVALTNLKNQKLILTEDLNNLLTSWNQQIQNESSQRGNIVQTLLVVDIAIFFLVIVVVRQSLNPLEIISRGMSRVKEGIYGEKINYKAEDEIGELVNTFNVMSDTIKQKTEEARATDIAKDEFLSMITHELKTPLVPIQGYVDILLGGHLGTLNEKQKERLKIIKTSSESLLRIISDLLDAQKLELGKLVVKKENHDIKDTIDKAVSSLQPRAAENKVIIKQNLEKEIIVPHDRERIMQVLTNLLKNGLDVVKPETGLIEVFVEDSQKEVVIKVKDNGPGIPKEKQDELFTKFYQVDTSLTREVGGSGLGLAICKGLVEEHGGKIYADSVPGRGSTFSFTLPKNNQA
jgi:signal transduction histidine kinase